MLQEKEYIVVDFDWDSINGLRRSLDEKTLEEQLNQLGENGWHLVSTHETKYGVQFIFMRDA